jgi:aspartate racemase
LSEIAKLSRQGADSVILGCTEVGMLISQRDIDLPVFDTTEIHATAAVDYTLGG